jgi:hypothetical protein
MGFISCLAQAFIPTGYVMDASYVGANRSLFVFSDV